MEHKEKVFSCVIAVLMFCLSCFGDMSKHQKAADDLLVAMNLSTLLSDSIESMLQLEMINNPELKPYESTIRNFYVRYMSGESLWSEFLQLYMNTFTEPELVEITAFYKTPVGQKSLKEAPHLMAAGAAIGQRRVMENIEELKRMIEEESSRQAALRDSNKTAN